ncbi:hypothetical protein B0H14DRAFT_2668837 [Mycena olivaceomarginata]|nr:hypothetical protein B0H14DRAFT_2668837 [Mycena olivaceomarginata]
MRPGRLGMVALKSPRVLMAAAVLLHFRGGIFSASISSGRRLVILVGETCRIVFGLETKAPTASAQPLPRCV